MKCNHDYKNPVKLGRAKYICHKCKEDITLDLVFIIEAEEHSKKLQNENNNRNTIVPMWTANILDYSLVQNS